MDGSGRREGGVSIEPGRRGIRDACARTHPCGLLIRAFDRRAIFLANQLPHVSGDAPAMRILPELATMTSEAAAGPHRRKRTLLPPEVPVAR